jgi:hypothetical protein
MLELKIRLNELGYTGTPEEIFSELSEAMPLPAILSKQEIVQWMARSMTIKRRLRNFEAKPLLDSDPMVEAQGFVGLLLEVAGTPEVDMIEVENTATLISSLVVGKIITAPEGEGLKATLERNTTRGEQDLGYLPTPDQINAALETQWPMPERIETEPLE